MATMATERRTASAPSVSQAFAAEVERKDTEIESLQAQLQQRDARIVEMTTQIANILGDSSRSGPAGPSLQLTTTAVLGACIKLG